MAARAIFLSLILVGVALEARADRIFYRAGTWLETSPEVQRLSLRAVLRGWERVAIEVDEAALAGGLFSPSPREALHVTHCLAGSTRRSITEVLRERVTAFASVDPDRVFYSLSDFIAASLRDLCPAR